MMSAAEMRDRVLDLIRDYLTKPKVQTDEISVLTLNALAGDIQVIRLDSTQNAGVPYVRPCPKCGLVPMPPCTCVELGDGEPSPPFILTAFVVFNSGFVQSVFSGRKEAEQYVAKMCKGSPEVEIRQVELVERSGAAQEVSPSANFVSEIRPRPDDPSCHVCGAQMVVKEWKCLSCKATTGVEEVSPPSPRDWWNKVAKEIATLQHMGIERTLELRESKIAEMIRDEWEREEGRLISADMMAVTNCEKLRVCRETRNQWKERAKKAEGDTRELKAALSVVEKAKAYVTICDDWRGDNSDGATSLRRKAFLELSEAVCG